MNAGQSLVCITALTNNNRQPYLPTHISNLKFIIKL